MKGLIIKDFYLVFQQKTSVLFLFAVAVMFNVVIDGMFGSWYMAMAAAMMVVGTLSYDEFDNGLPFLMTLPVSRRTYVKEKYIFSLVFCGMAWLLGVITCIITSIFTKTDIEIIDMGVTSAIFVPIMLAYLFVVIPLQIKFGSEKGKILSLCTLGAIIAAVFFIARNNKVIDVISAFFNDSSMDIGMAAIMTAVYIGSAVIGLVSYGISCRIMERKDF